MAVVGLVVLIASFLVRHRRVPMRAAAVVLVATGAGVSLLPLVVDAYPTTYRRPLVTYHATSIAAGMVGYPEHCAACHGAMGAGGGASAAPPPTSPPPSRPPPRRPFWLGS